MFTFSLSHAGVYRHIQPPFTQLIQCPWLMMHVSGLRRRKDVDGVLDVAYPEPFISIGVPGTRVYVEYERPRENYVLMFDKLSVRRSDRVSCVDLEFESSWVTVPEIVYVDRGQVPGLVLDFSRVVECFHNPLPSNRLDAQLTVCSILSRFVEGSIDLGQADTPSAALRRLLDEDKTFLRPLTELSLECGYSADHLRALFRAAYGIAPQEYRNQRRIARVMQLVAETRLTAKEIAARTGFSYLSHFSAFFRQHAGMTPRQAIAKYRHREELT